MQLIRDEYGQYVKQPPATPHEIRERIAAQGTAVPSGCIEWTGYVNENGYGVINIRHKLSYAHRVAWQQVNGEIPPGGCILHRCDNPRCINVEHLFLGTRTDNALDKVQKGRMPRGSALPGARLTEDNVRDILVRLEAGERQKDIAASYGVSRSAVAMISNRTHWKHVAVAILAALALLLPTARPALADDGRITAFCDHGYMADGNWTHLGAAGGAWWLPLGSIVRVEGWGDVIVEDRGSAPYTLDLWVPRCDQAWDWGVRYPAYTVLRWGWGGG